MSNNIHHHHKAHSHLSGHHHHVHVPANYNKAFAVGIILNVAYIIIELIYGLLADSMSLIADAGHNLSDVLGLLLAWGATFLAVRKASNKKTYGMKKATILASLFNAIILLITVGAISVEAIRKFFEPEAVAGTTIIIVAAVGVIINGITAFLFMEGRKKDLNIKGAYLHMLADAGVSVGVVLGGFLINLTGYNIIDPIIGLVIVGVITVGTWSLLKESFNLSMDAVPESINYEEVHQYISSLESVENVHHLHIWGLSTTEYALTSHVVMKNGENQNKFIDDLYRNLREKFNINHPTIQIELSSTKKCNKTDCLVES